jgi:hypothetical protein
MSGNFKGNCGVFNSAQKPMYHTCAIISHGLYFFYPFFTAAATYTAERPLFLDSFSYLNCTLNAFFFVFLTEEKSKLYNNALGTAFSKH